jgi:hypothetical protein
MSRLLRTLALTAAALSLVAASGCGGDTKTNNDYVNALNKAQTDFAAGVGKIQTSAAPGKAQDVFTNLKASVDKVVADIKAVKPPDKVKDLHATLVGELESFGSAIDEAGNALNEKDPAKVAAAQSKFATAASSAGTKITQTIADINAKLQQ